MHRICKFNLDIQYNKYVDKKIVKIMKNKVKHYNELSEQLELLKKDFDKNEQQINYLINKLKKLYLKILYSNPAGFLVTARITTNYRCLKNIYLQRHNHRLPE